MTRHAREGEAVRKRREIAQNAQKCAHKKETVRIARTPGNHQKSATKKEARKTQQNATQKKHRTKSEARGISNFATRTRARDGCAGNLCTRYARGKIGTTCCPAGEFVHTITRACPAAGVNLFTRICAGEKFGISDTLKEFLNTRARGKYPQFSQSLKDAACCRECLSGALYGP